MSTNNICFEIKKYYADTPSCLELCDFVLSTFLVDFLAWSFILNENIDF